MMEWRDRLLASLVAAVGEHGELDGRVTARLRDHLVDDGLRVQRWRQVCGKLIVARKAGDRSDHGRDERTGRFRVA